MKFERIDDYDILLQKNEKSEWGVLMLHGYGANSQDLAPLGEMLGFAANWYFVNGPLEVPIGPMMTGRAWFPIDMMGLQNAVATDRFSEFFCHTYPPGFLEASEKIQKLFLTLSSRHKKWVLSGFSQGSMVVTHTALQNPDKVDKLAVFSGTHIRQEGLSELEGTSPFQTFQSHGEFDPVLPVAEARELKDELIKINPSHQYIEFRGGHEIPLEVIQAAGDFLNA